MFRYHKIPQAWCSVSAENSSMLSAGPPKAHLENVLQACVVALPAWLPSVPSAISSHPPPRIEWSSCWYLLDQLTPSGHHMSNDGFKWNKSLAASTLTGHKVFDQKKKGHCRCDVKCIRFQPPKGTDDCMVMCCLWCIHVQCVAYSRVLSLGPLHCVDYMFCLMGYFLFIVWT